MVRRCAVPYCTNSDLTILSHRFPRRIELASKWATNLELNSIYTLPELIDKFTICCLHFEESAYRNAISNHLNITAVPKRQPENPRFKKATATKCDEESSSPPTINTNCTDVIDEVQGSPRYDHMIVEDDADADDEIGCFEMETIEDDDVESEVPQKKDYFQDVMDALDWERSSPSPEEIAPLEPEHLENSEVYILSDYAANLRDMIYCNESSGDGAESGEELSVASSFCQIEKSDAAVQVGGNELERDDEDEEYAHLSRSELVGQLKEALQSVAELQQKLDNFQDVHTKLQQSMEAFKTLMGNL